MELHTLSTLCVEPNIPPKTNQQWDEEVSLNYPAGDKEIQGTWSCCRYMQRGEGGRKGKEEQVIEKSGGSLLYRMRVISVSGHAAW